MKLDKIKFATLLNWIGRRGIQLETEDVRDLDNLIDIDVPEATEPEKVYPLNGQVESLMKHMAGGTNKIDAIREHRAITGMGLKESKDIVEKYWTKKEDKSKLQRMRLTYISFGESTDD